MDSSTNSGIQSSYIIEIEPLNVSHDLEKESGFEVDIWSWSITNQFPISTIDKIDSENVILNIGSPHQGYTIQTKIRNGKLIKWESYYQNREQYGNSRIRVSK